MNITNHSHSSCQLLLVPLQDEPLLQHLQTPQQQKASRKMLQPLPPQRTNTHAPLSYEAYSVVRAGAIATINPGDQKAINIRSVCILPRPRPSHHRGRLSLYVCPSLRPPSLLPWRCYFQAFPSGG